MSKKKGFTLIELLLIIGLMGILISIATISLLNIKQSTSLDLTITTLVSDIKSQQLKSMIGNAAGAADFSYPYGVHFNQDNYVLFHRASYLSSDPNNFTVDLTRENVQIVNPNTDIIFSRGSGELGATTSIILQEKASSKQKTVQLNSYGVITNIN